MLKHFKRSVVVFVAVLVAVAVLTLVGGVVSGLTSSFLDSLLPATGHLQIQAQGTENAINPMDLKYLIPNANEVMARLKDPRIVHVEKILSFPALLVQPVETNTRAKNLGLQGQGVDPHTQFFTTVREGLTQGRFLPGGRGIVISETVARLLDVKLGGSVMVLTTDRSNAPWYQELKITGLFRSGSDLVDQGLFFVSHKTAEELLDADGMTREIRILIKNPDQSAEVRDVLKKELPPSQFEIRTWQEVLGSLLTILQLLNVVSAFLRVFFVIVAASVIANSILMSILERVREYGTLRAIGLKRRQLWAMVLTEGGLLGLFGSLAGLAVGWIGVAYLAQVGIDVGSATEYFGFSSRIYPALNLADGVFNLVAGLLIAVLSTAYAARTVARLSVVDSLNHP
ncbi:MAG: ABC transporter permease [Spirochaetales bacterium]|nr:ABC transporter permease [Spirochaetales bacterium]